MIERPIAPVPEVTDEHRDRIMTAIRAYRKRYANGISSEIEYAQRTLHMVALEGVERK